MEKIISIGMPGKFDPVFGLMKVHHPALMEPLYAVVWLETGEQVMGSGGFMNPIQAENWVEENRLRLIDKDFEEKFLVNE